MKCPKMPEFAQEFRNFLSKRSPEILTGIGITGMVTSTVLAVRATPRALILLDEEVCAQNPDKKLYDKDIKKRISMLSKKDIIRVTWKCYVPSATISALSIACIIGASKANLRRNAVLSTAYALSENALKDYQEKVIESIGENKERTIRDQLAKDRMERDPVTSKEVIITEKGNTLCYDSMSGRYFKSDADTLKKVENILDRRLRDEMFITLNDLYYEIGLDPISLGDDLGWHIDNGYIELFFSSQLANDGTPCLVVDYHTKPLFVK